MANGVVHNSNTTIGPCFSMCCDDSPKREKVSNQIRNESGHRARNVASDRMPVSKPCPDRRQMAIKLNPHDRGRRDGDGIGCQRQSGPPWDRRSERCGGAPGGGLRTHPTRNRQQMTKIGCEDKALLAKEYENATAVFSEKVKELRQKMGTSSKHEYART